MKSERPHSELDPETPFVDRLEHQLRAASARNIQQAGVSSSADRSWGRGLAYAAVVLLLVGAVALWPGGQDSVAADVFDIQQRGTSVEVTVIELIDNGDEALEELSEAGLEVEVVMVPVSPSLVGRLVGVHSLDGGDLDLVSVDGVAVESFVIEVGAGRLMIEIGETAEGDETYLFSQEPALCVALAGPQSARDVRDALGGSAHEIRWLEVAGTNLSDVTEAELADKQLIVTEVTPEREGASVVFVTLDLSQPGCGD